MKRFFTFKKLLVALTVFCLVASPSLQVIIPTDSYKVYAESPQDTLNRLQQQIDDIKNQKASLQSQLDSNTYTINGYNSQVSSLQGQATLYGQDLDQLRLEIEQLDTNIQILNDQIDANQKQIATTEDSIASLDQESTIRLENTYMNYRLYGTVTGGNAVFAMDNINSYFKDSQYKEIIQSSTNDLLQKVADLKQKLADDKAALVVQLTNVKRDKEAEDIKKTDMDKKVQDIDLKLAEYNTAVSQLQQANNSQQAQINQLNSSEQQISAQQILIMQQIILTEVPSNTYVYAGTVIGFQGNTGYVIPLPSPGNPTAGTHLHFEVYANGVAVNPCDYVQPGDGCGSDGNPLSPPLRGNVVVTQWFTGPYNHNAIDIVALPVQNEPVYAAHNGWLTRGTYCYEGTGYPINGCANYAKIRGDDGLITAYWHLAN